MILPVVLIFISTTIAQDLYEGDPCYLSNGTSGHCTWIMECPIIRDRINLGHRPDKRCEFAGHKAIVCCPTEKKPVGDGRGEIARKKCADYANSVTTSEESPTLEVHEAKVKISQCAINYDKLIIGGEHAEPKEFPHMAALGYSSIASEEILWLCGGTLISETYVLTAAHCLWSRDYGRVQWVRLGDLNLNYGNDDDNVVQLKVTNQTKYKRHKVSSLYHDIALLRLEYAVSFNAWIRPACLHTAPSTGTHNIIATGWGRTGWDEDVGSVDLLKVVLPLVDQQVCKKSYPKDATGSNLQFGVFSHWMICAGSGNKDTCQGDSGGPLVVYSPKEYYCMYDVVGVTSLGQLCGEGIPGIYTRVYHYISWIEQIVWGQG